MKKGKKNMKVLIDTNILIDFLTAREPFFEDSKMIIRLAEMGNIEAYITSNTITDTFYILRKSYTAKEIKSDILLLLEFLDIVGAVKSDIIASLHLEFSDYEDGFQSQCASKIQADYIITRNLKDFSTSKVNAVCPTDFIKIIYHQNK